MKNIGSNSVKIQGSGHNPALQKLFDNAGIDVNVTGRQRWEELENLFQVIGSMIIEIATQVNENIRVIRQFGYEDNRELVTTVNGITSDITTYSDNLKKIHERHEGKTGLIHTSDDLSAVFSIFSDYNALQESFKSVVFPHLLTITEHLDIAATEFRKKQNLQNPEVVSDVEFKEAQNG